MTTARGDDLDIYYEQIGQGDRLLLLNGSGGTIDHSRILINKLAEHFEVVVHDQRGLGMTGLSRGANYSMELYASDAVTVLDDVGWDRAHVVGVSFGGMVAQELAVRFGERLNRIVMCCTSPGGAGGSSYPLHELDSRPRDEARQISRLNLDSRFSDEWFAQHPLDKALWDFMSGDTGDDPPEVAEGKRQQLDARRYHDAYDRLDQITNSTLVMAGRYDGTAPLANCEAMAQKIPNCELRVYEGGHAFLIQDRRAMTDLREFLTD